MFGLIKSVYSEIKLIANSLDSIAKEQDALDYFTDANGQRVSRNILPLKTEYLFKAGLICAPTVALLNSSLTSVCKDEMQYKSMCCIANVFVNALGSIVATAVSIDLYRTFRYPCILLTEIFRGAAPVHGA